MYNNAIIMEIFDKYVKGEDKLLKLSLKSGEYILIKEDDEIESYGDYLQINQQAQLLKQDTAIHFIDAKEIINISVIEDISESLKDMIFK